MPNITSAMSLIREAIKTNPKLKILLGVAAIGAVTLIVFAFTLGDPEQAILGGVFIVGFMILLTIFTALSENELKRPFLTNFLIWSISMAFVAAIAMMFSSWPAPMG